ncbi:MAG: hypothetical protein KDD39_12755, partial [Bdellovibrionales bacterium]|nr:hypothetical protein [Bdellovibrionales bacterium]
KENKLEFEHFRRFVRSGEAGSLRYHETESILVGRYHGGQAARRSFYYGSPKQLTVEEARSAYAIPVNNDLSGFEVLELKGGYFTSTVAPLEQLVDGKRVLLKGGGTQIMVLDPKNQLKLVPKR